MSMFTLAISCLTTSNLPWFTDLTCQISMQYCSLQHWTLLSPPDISTTGSFCFGPASSFLLDIFLCSSSVAYWVPTDLVSSSFSVIFFAFSHCSWGSQGKNAEVVWCSLLQWFCILQVSISSCSGGRQHSLPDFQNKQEILHLVAGQDFLLVLKILKKLCCLSAEQHFTIGGAH